jgi:hypothetical protein
VNKSSKPGLVLFAAVTVIGMIMAVAPAATAASPARDIKAHIHVLAQSHKTASVASCATAHTCYQIQSWGHPGYCLNAVASGVHNNGDKVQLWQCNWTGTNQLWRTGSCDLDGATEWCTIENAADTSKCLNATNSPPLGDGSKVQLWSCSGTATNNLWSFQTPDQPCFSISYYNPAFYCLQVEAGNWIVQDKTPWSGNGDQALMWNAAQETMPADIGFGTFLYQG